MSKIVLGDTKNVTVFGIEHIKELIDLSLTNLNKNNLLYLESKEIKMINKDGRQGLKENNLFDFIHVGGSLNYYPKELISQLSSNGMLFAPIKEGNGEEFLNVFFKEEKTQKIKRQKSISTVKLNLNLIYCRNMFL